MATLTLDTAQGSLLDAIEERPSRAGRPPEARRRAAESAAPGNAGEDRSPGRPAPDSSLAPESAAAPSAVPARTLDDLIAGAWSAVSMTQTTACPLCGDELLPRFGAGPQPVAGACRSCGTELA